MGAPESNRNAVTTGRRCRLPIVLGTAPKGRERQIADTRRLVAAARQAVVVIRVATSIHDESLLLELGQWEATRRLCWAEMVEKWSSLTSEQRSSLARDAAKAATERTRCMKALGLAVKPEDLDPWAQLHKSNQITLAATSQPSIGTSETPQAKGATS